MKCFFIILVFLMFVCVISNRRNIHNNYANAEDIHLIMGPQADTTLKYKYIFNADTVYVYRDSISIITGKKSKNEEF